MSAKIVNVRGYEILDSRGYPTIEAELTLSDGVIANASVPSGASIGVNEAVELRDQDSNRFMGKGVLGAIANINDIIANKLVGIDVCAQSVVDSILLELDGTDNKSFLGANAILAVSLATARAASISAKMPLYRYLGGIGYKVLPVPMMNIINGGVHTNSKLDIQEFMIVPVGFSSISDVIHCGAKIFHTLAGILDRDGFSTAVGDEGGFAPHLSSHQEVFEYIMIAIEQAGFTPGEDVMLAIDCAASVFYNDGNYLLESEDATYSSEEWVAYLEGLVNTYPIISIEDGMSEDDHDGWLLLSKVLGNKIQLVGDDLFVTNVNNLVDGIRNGIANALLVKMNQVGTLTETIAAIRVAMDNGYNTIVSHRSGETIDCFLIDLAVGLNCGQVKIGSLSRSERVAKYNRLLYIEDELKNCAFYPGNSVF